MYVNIYNTYITWQTIYLVEYNFYTSNLFVSQYDKQLHDEYDYTYPSRVLVDNYTIDHLYVIKCLLICV